MKQTYEEFKQSKLSEQGRNPSVYNFVLVVGPPTEPGTPPQTIRGEEAFRKAYDKYLNARE